MTRGKKASRSISHPLDDLVVYCVSEILAGGEECTFERLVYECFTKFPESFGLARYPEWPDSARVNKSWLRCRTDRGWIVGTVQEGFRLTPAGEAIAAIVGNRLADGAKPPTVRQSGARTRERHEALLRTIRSDQLFRVFEETGTVEASEMELRRLLGATLETPKRVLRQNLHAYRSAAEAYSDEPALEFLLACEKIIAT